MGNRNSSNKKNIKKKNKKITQKRQSVYIYWFLKHRHGHPRLLRCGQESLMHTPLLHLTLS